MSPALKAHAERALTDEEAEAVVRKYNADPDFLAKSRVVGIQKAAEYILRMPKPQERVTREEFDNSIDAARSSNPKELWKHLES